MICETATQRFWASFPAGCTITIEGLWPDYDTEGSVYAGDERPPEGPVALRDFLLDCHALTGEWWVNPLNQVDELVAYVGEAVRAAYGRADACVVRILP